MKIQYAIDGALGEGIRVAHKIEEYVDIIEVGDGVLQRESLRAITLLKQIFPDKKILADLKLMDGGYTLGKEAYALGADIVTVCAAADTDCIAGLVRAAQEVGKESWVDLIGIEPRNYRDYVAAVNASGADYVCVHLSGRLFRDEPGIYARKDAIRLAAGYFDSTLRTGIPVRFLSNAGPLHSREPVVTEEYHGREHVKELMLRLAALPLCSTEAFPTFLGTTCRTISSSDIVILTCYANADIFAYARQKQAMGSNVRLIHIGSLPDTVTPPDDLPVFTYREEGSYGTP